MKNKSETVEEMTTHVENYFTEGCMRCSLGGTPDCKVHRWQRELAALQQILLDCHLDETCKWGVPCYTFQGKNIAVLSALKDSCIISFFKGSLLRDELGILTFAGENSHVSKMLRFTHLEDILKMENHIKAYIFEAIEVEKMGLKVEKSHLPNLPAELEHKFETFPALKTAFEALTPGRQRSWILHFSQPKQSQTRISRIENALQKILSGKGFHDK